MARGTQANLTTKDTKYKIDRLARMTPALRKMFGKNFDNLSSKQKDRAAVLKSLQGFYPKDPDYKNKKIVAEVLGLATKEYDTVGRDDIDRRITLGDQKKRNPAGFSTGGRVHRGRKATGNKD